MKFEHIETGEILLFIEEEMEMCEAFENDDEAAFASAEADNAIGVDARGYYNGSLIYIRERKKMRFFAWYAGGDYYPTNTPDSCGYEPSGWYEAETPQEAAKLAKADGCQWTTVRITKDASTQPYGDNVLSEA